MIAVDTNLLVYAHPEDSSFHEAAYSCLRELAEDQALRAISWACIHKFLAIVTHPRIYAPPTPLEKAIDQVEPWMESPALVLLSASEDYWPQIRDLLQKAHVTGPQVHDAQVAALSRDHGVS